jgi:hypothetical protein
MGASFTSVVGPASSLSPKLRITAAGIYQFNTTVTGISGSGGSSVYNYPFFETPTGNHVTIRSHTMRATGIKR